MLLAFSMWIIPYFIIERVKPIEKPICICRQCPYVKRYASKRSMHPTQWGIQIVQFYSLLSCKKIPHIMCRTRFPSYFEMVLSTAGDTGLSPNGKATDFGSVICGFKSHQPRLPRLLGNVHFAFLLLPSSSAELTKGASNVPDGFS